MSIRISLSVDVDTGGEEPISMCLFDENYTHNVTPMWKKAGVYNALYNSDGLHADDILDKLSRGVQDMESKPDEYKLFNPENEWGDYEGALEFLSEFYEACQEHPKSIIGVSK